MEMKLLLNSGAELVIELVDSPLVHDWAERLCELPLDETEVSGFDNRNIEWDFDKFKSLFHILHNKLSVYQAGADYWSKIQDFDDHDYLQQMLNDLHHWCVEEVNLEHKRWAAPGHAERVKDFGEMNSLCHQLETLLTHGTRQIPNSCRNMYWDQQVVNQTQHALQINEDWWKLTTQDKYDVYVAKRILGKDYRECYRDNDDATRTEMGPNRKTVPLAFEFDPLNQWQDFYNNADFLEWLPVEPSNENIGRIPIGNLKYPMTKQMTRDMISQDSIREITV